MTLARLSVGGTPRLHGNALLVAIGSIVGVSVLSALFPRWAGRVTLPLLAITSVGVYLTVPDVERVSVVMVILVIAAAYSAVKRVEPDQVVRAGVAVLIMGAAVMDSGGRAAAIVRAAGCFGVLLAAPTAQWLSELLSDGAVKRRPALPVLVIVHCLVVGWSSRALIRETSLSRVIPGIAAALVVAAMVLVAAARPVAVET
ncbi:MAG: hypothetical protein QOG30_3019 [Acidimicrobiaceae bacterium]